MPTEWIHEVFVMGEAASIGEAIQALDIAFPRDDGSPRDATKPDLYASKYSATGQEPATHYGAAFVVTEQIRQTLEGMGLNQVPGITYWRASNPEGILTATNRSGDVAQVGQPWTWENCLASMGLQSVANPVI